VLDRDLSVDTTKNYVRFFKAMKYGGMGWSSRQFDNDIAESIINELNDNPYKILRKIKGESVEWFLKYESLFVIARKNNALSDYWLYLETLLSFNRTDKQVMGIVSSIMLTNEEFIMNRRVLSTLMYIFLPIWDGPRLLNVTQEKWKKIIASIRKGRISKEIRKFDYPFVKELVSEYDSKLDHVFYKKSKDYYYGILIEAYEYRNFFIHRGLDGEALKAKLAVTLPNIIDRMRWAILKELKGGKENIPFDLVIDDLVKKGESLLTN
jgi:hypothetical protein